LDLFPQYSRQQDEHGERANCQNRHQKTMIL
jgi:hypothetical protein